MTSTGKQSPVRTEAYRALDEFEKEARAGAPDEWLARYAKVSVKMVLEWRKSRDIPRKRGPKGLDQRLLWAIDIFGDQQSYTLHRCSSSPISGEWATPEFLVRIPIQYDLFCRYAHLLAREGIPPAQIASSFGFKERDVELALELELAHLERVGQPCPNCGSLVDPATGTFCSQRCKPK